MATMQRREADLSAILSFGLVLVPLGTQIVARLLDPWYGGYTTIFNGEAGFIELGTAAILIAVVVLMVRIGRDLHRAGETANAVLALLLAFGAFLFMGEEISWGQWLFHWDSPDWFLTYNEQGETNLHNLVFVKKDIPKWIVVAGIAAFGLVLPLRGFRTSGRIGPFDANMLPTVVCVPTALVVVLMHVAVKLVWWIGGIELEPLIGIDLREATEFYIALFGLVYAMSLAIRIRAASLQSSAARAVRRQNAIAGSAARGRSASLTGKPR